MIADVGFIAILLAFLVSVYATIVALYGNLRQSPRWIESGRNAAIIAFPLVTIACGLMIYALVTGQFYIQYVAEVTSRDTSTILKVTALWGSQTGSILFWNFLLTGFTAAAMARKWQEEKELMPYVIVVAAFSQAFFLFISVFLENPFARIASIPPDGQGLNPLLRHPGMIIHPPLLYLGFVSFTIPYAFAMAALITGKLDDHWIQTTRRWTLVSWLFLSLGIVLGGRWAYDVLGWGGYWAWDPVENASLMPWLAATAFLHSVMIQEKTGMFKMWNMFLIVLTYGLMAWGTFTVRSGVISSVHSFARSAIGPYIFGYVVLIIVFSAYWITRRNSELRSDNEITSMLSREAAFLYNNFLILIILVVVFVFTNFPLISELFTGEQIFVGPEVYETALAPLFGALLVLMGIAPMTMWYRTSIKRIEMPLRRPALAALIVVGIIAALGVRSPGGLVGFYVVSFAAILTLLEFWKGTKARMGKGEPVWTAFSRLMARNRRRYGGYWIHMGVIVMGFGIVGVEVFQQETQINLAVGETVGLGRYEMQFMGIQEMPGRDDLLITQADIDVYENGRFVTTLTPQSELYQRSGQPMTIPASRSTISDDFYVLIANWEGISEAGTTFKVYLNPLINWVWAGAFIFMIGTAIAGWPDPRRQTAVSPRPRVASIPTD